MASSSVSDSVSTRASSLVALVDSGANYAAISGFLDALSADERVAQVLAVTGSRVGKLYEAVKGGPAVTVADFIPAGTADGDTVIYEGRNSLPMFSRFQKRFCRGEGGVVVGYNHQTMSFVTGPGFFVCKDGDETHPTELLFDYTLKVPFVPDGWPAYKPNESGLSRAVYAHMKDYCRRVATGIVVGEAFKEGVRQNAYFSLSLQPAGASRS